MIEAEEKNDKILGGMRKEIAILDGTFDHNTALMEKLNATIALER